jgi:hypothetical protein
METALDHTIADVRALGPDPSKNLVEVDGLQGGVLDVELDAAARPNQARNAGRYPPDKARGHDRKYTGA